MIIIYIIVDITLIVIMSMVIFLVLPVKYSVNVLMKDKHTGFSFRVKLLLNMIILEGAGSGKDIEMNLKVFFFRKKLNVKNRRTANSGRDFNIYDFIINIKKYRANLKKILDKLKPSFFKIEGRYGFSNPSNTGMIAGLICMVKPFFKVADIDLKPNFFDEELYINMGICGRIRPVTIMNFGGVLWILKKMQRRFFQNLRISLKQKPS